MAASSLSEAGSRPNLKRLTHPIRIDFNASRSSMVKSKNVGTRGVRLGLDVSTAASSWKLRDGAKHPSNPGSLSAIAIGSGSIPSPFTACMEEQADRDRSWRFAGLYVLRVFSL